VSKIKQNPYEPVDASPVKSFFVYMLTRDIRLEDAILDLLDNCVDGILRSKVGKASTRTKKPYEGFWAHIKFDKDTFEISDNCGGIPWSLHPYAFTMGREADTNRPKDASGTVGAYGIGMKRAIFKMGKQCSISTRNESDAYDVEIEPDWIEKKGDWMLPVEPSKSPLKHQGTTIIVGALHDVIADRFSIDRSACQKMLKDMIETHYAVIIDKGLEVKINGVLAKARPMELLFAPQLPKMRKDTRAIRPFMFKTKTEDGVEVFLAVGFTGPIPDPDDAASDQTPKHSAQDAGWTILCNDRAVVYCDRTELTGWGEAGVPRYHNQFIAISGIVEFQGDSSKLPTTTTKRDVDASSRLYLQIKNKMREGMRIFTDYTNKWKKDLDESRSYLKAGERLTLEEIKSESAHLVFNSTTKSVPPGEQFRPELPMPKKLEPRQRRISFVKSVEDIRTVAEYLIGEADADPSTVGEECFDLMLKDARK
jgi:Histidine kinase-, DNA gyrase B-, and HSP90-like ATPase